MYSNKDVRWHVINRNMVSMRVVQEGTNHTILPKYIVQQRKWHAINRNMVSKTDVEQ